MPANKVQSCAAISPIQDTGFSGCGLLYDTTSGRSFCKNLRYVWRLLPCLQPVGLHAQFEGLVKSLESPLFVIPAQAGILCFQLVIDSRLRGSDVVSNFL